MFWSSVAVILVSQSLIREDGVFGHVVFATYKKTVGFNLVSLEINVFV